MIDEDMQESIQHFQIVDDELNYLVQHEEIPVEAVLLVCAEWLSRCEGPGTVVSALTNSGADPCMSASWAALIRAARDFKRRSVALAPTL